jgi:hypothetical protein
MTDPAQTKQLMFFLTEGGPTYRIERRLGLIREQSPLILRRAFFSMLITWVPLFILSALQGNAFGHNVEVPFLRDFAVHARFLLALPLLLFAETLLGPHMAHASIHFVRSGLVLEEDFKRFDSAVAEGIKWRDSTVAEFVLFLLSYSFTAIALSSMAVKVSTWHAIHVGSRVAFTWSGWWFVLICVPLFQFLVLRWIWRLFLWGKFLWRMSKLNLQLVATHPDEAGGLAFVGEAHRFFAVILFAFSTAASGVLANNVVYDHTPLRNFAPLIVAYAIISVLIVLVPMLVFCPILLQTKRKGLHKYGTLATEYTTSFQKKWIDAPHPREEVLLGTGDIQSLSDLGNSFSIIEKMGPLPMGPRTPIVLVLACLIPMVPLLLTVMPLEDVIKMLFKVVM